MLIFLEALALGRKPPAFGLHLCSQLLAAAQHLGLRALEVRVTAACRRCRLLPLPPLPGCHALLRLCPAHCHPATLQFTPASMLPPALPQQEYCQERLGECKDRLRFFSFEEVKRLNAAGGCWLILDGMVLDVTRWLPEHPGGSTIIPRQALNLDCR